MLFSYSKISLYLLLLLISTKMNLVTKVCIFLKFESLLFSPIKVKYNQLNRTSKNKFVCLLLFLILKVNINNL